MTAYAVEFPDRVPAATFDATDTPALTRRVATYCRRVLCCGYGDVELDPESGAVRTPWTNQAWPFTNQAWPFTNQAWPFVVYRRAEQAVPRWAGDDRGRAGKSGGGDPRRTNSDRFPPPA